ncbi:MAG: hypothetical protein JWN90_501 [Parcubacteria group bacterium]|nr:hypothetical protein [Parcubacteria group bacterium]
MTMNTLLVLAREVALRLVVAGIGYFVSFGAYLFLFAAHTKHILGIKILAQVALSTLVLPFIDLVRTPIVLVHLLHAPKIAVDHAFSAGIIRSLITSIGMELVLFVLLAASIVAFERSPKTRISTIFFYAVMPALLWLIWSQLYLFFG